MSEKYVLFCVCCFRHIFVTSSQVVEISYFEIVSRLIILRSFTYIFMMLEIRSKGSQL